ncbi:unnamed protein product [Prorocentrum cordatum]|uniref:RNA-directed RNA polymerase n=1 Tax=Prorocentrum cordatum TaxID=2364126 RepID=A0ABN9VND3_9DINO|nr:unnamed protein product [Polarella glacialis]
MAWTSLSCLQISDDHSDELRRSQLRELAVALADVALRLFQAERNIRASLVPAPGCVASYPEQLLSRFEVEGTSLKDCRPAPAEAFLAARPRLRGWLAEKLHLVVVPEEVKGLLAVHVDPATELIRVLTGLTDLPHDLAVSAIEWLFKAYDDPARGFTPEIKRSLQLLQREDGTFGTFGSYTWSCPGPKRELVHFQKPSKHVVKDTRVSEHFDSRLGVLDPMKLSDVALSVDGIAVDKFWKVHAEGGYKDQDLCVLEGKMHVHVRTRHGKALRALQRYGAVSTADELDALLAIGCVQALDPVPAPYAGTETFHVVRHLSVLRGSIDVSTATSTQKHNIFQRYLLPGIEDSSARPVLMELPIVKCGRQHYALKNCRFVNSTSLAQKLEDVGLPVLNTSSMFNDHRVVLQGHFAKPGDILSHFHNQLANSGLTEQLAAEILLEAARAASSDPDQLKLVAKCRILREGRCMSDLWHPGDELAFVLGVVDRSIQQAVSQLAAITDMAHCMKACSKPADLMELLRQSDLQRLRAGACDRVANALHEVLQGMSEESVKQITSAGFRSLPVIYANGSWHKSEQVYLQCYKDLLPDCKPVLNRHFRQTASARSLFAGRPAVDLVAEHLVALCEHPDRVHPDRSAFLRIYDYLNTELKTSQSAAPQCLKSVRCILDQEGKLFLPRHFGLELLMDLAPFHMVPEDVRPYKYLLVDLGAKEKGGGDPLPDPVLPTEICDKLRTDLECADIQLQARDGVLPGHRCIWHFAAKNLGSLLPPDQNVSLILPCSMAALAAVRDFVYTGRVDFEAISKLTPAHQHEMRAAARALNIPYLAEYMKQFLAGAPPDIEDPYRGSTDLPQHWARNIGNLSQGWRLENLQDPDLLGILQQVLTPGNPSDLGHGRDCGGWPSYRQLNSRVMLGLAHRARGIVVEVPR